MPGFGDLSPEQRKKMMEEMQRKEYEGLTPEEIEEKKRQKELQKQKNIQELNETLELFKNGGYEAGGNHVQIELPVKEMSEIRVFLPDEIRGLPEPAAEGTQACVCSCEDADALSLARKRAESSTDGHVLVLNLCSSSRPGGAVRDGANGQEEDLCRKSSLLLSLENDAAKSYYDYNNALHSQLGSDAIMVSPNVEVVRDENGDLLQQPFCISVISCSAPMVRLGLEGKTEDEYKELLYQRILGILRTSSSLGYRDLILGAFGCGVFGNDAAVVSDAFKRALSGPEGNQFSHVDFAVLCKDGKDYNYKEFCRNFG